MRHPIENTSECARITRPFIFLTRSDDGTTSQSNNDQRNNRISIVAIRYKITIGIHITIDRINNTDRYPPILPVPKSARSIALLASNMMNDYPVACEADPRVRIGLDLTSSNEDESSDDDEKDLGLCAPQSTSFSTTVDAASVPHPITPECSQQNLQDISLPTLRRRFLDRSKLESSCNPVAIVEDEVQHTKESLFTEPTDIPKRASKLGAIYSIIAAILVLPVVLGLYSGPRLQFPSDSSIYVPGAGFSGFWYTMGRLQSIEDPASKDYVCYSSGCLASVATLNNFTIDEIACVAFSIQRLWNTGAISRYEVVSQFVDSLVFKIAPSELDPMNCPATLGWGDAEVQDLPLADAKLLARLNMLTTTKQGRYGVEATMRTPSDLDQLWQMLVQTTWIPAATGNDVWNDGHMDGAFSLWQHPKCSVSVSLPYNVDLFVNSLNVNLSRKKLNKFWAIGKVFGLQ